MTKYVVTAAVVVAKTDSETGEGYFYKDATLPVAGSAKVRENHEFLADSGLVERVEEEAEPAVPAEDPKPRSRSSKSE